MGRHSIKKGLRRSLINPAIVGLVVVGAAFVGLALTSQRTPPLVVSAEDSVSKTRMPFVPLASIDAPNEGRRLAIVLPKAPPVSLDVNAIDVHSRLHDLGLDSNGAIEVPSGARYDEAGWYRHSPTPGSLGPSIILGHVDSASDGPSVFFRLGDLVTGDRISVTRKDGSIARFVVQTVARYSKDEFPTERVYGNLDHAGLRLITCGGDFDDTSGHYEDNIVVFARLDPPRA